MPPAWEISCRPARAGAQQLPGQSGWGDQIQLAPSHPRVFPWLATMEVKPDPALLGHSLSLGGSNQGIKPFEGEVALEVGMV